MNLPLVARLEKALVLLLAASFALPLALGLVLCLPQLKPESTAWLRNLTLSGVQIQPVVVTLSPSTMLSARYQAALANNYNLQFPGRELMIRCIDEVYLHAFHTTPVGVLVGPHLSLIEAAYPEEYCLRRPQKDELRPLVEDLRRMQDFCDTRHIAFALVITPSKAAIYPENMPAGWMSRYKPGPRYYDTLLPLLQEKGVRYVDGHRIAADLKSTAPVSVFPLGGVHWSDPTALATVNALLEVLARQGLGVQTIRNYQTKISDDPTGQDSDMADLINIMFPLRYPVANVTVEPVASSNTYRPNMVLIGGSFTWKMLDLLDASRQFSETEFYFYYKNSKNCRVDGELHQLAAPTPPINFDTDIFAADSLVLEINEQTLHTTDHLTVFLHDALAVLPDPSVAKAPFHYESRMQYQWGNTLSFMAGRNPIDIAITKGFTTPDNIGSYTLGSVASLHFTAPAPTEDMVLEINAGAFLVSKRLPEQRVSVYANGHAVGERVWNKVAPSRREVVIPKEFLSGGDVLLEFKIARPGSPAEFGLSIDSRKFGIYVSSLRLHAVGK